MDATQWLTLVLVIITGIYVWLTHKAVDEARQTRELQVRPYLKLHIQPAGGGIVFPAVVNAGVGAATDLEVTLVLGLHSGGEATVELIRRYMAPGEMIELLVKDPGNPGRPPVRFNELSKAFGYLRLRATAIDVLGKSHEFEDAIDDLPAWFEAWGATWTRATPDQAKRGADALEKIAKALKDR